MNETVLVLGGGFIGASLAQSAAARGYSTTVVTLNPRPASSLEQITLDLRKPLDRALSFDYIINCTGYIDHTLFGKGGRGVIDQHLTTLFNIVEAVDRTRLKRFVQMGSSDEYGSQEAPQHESMREAPISPYSFAKTAAGQFLQMLHRTEGFPSVIVRPFLVYGPGQDGRRFLPQIIGGALRDEVFPASAGEQLRDFCYMDDFVEGVFRVMTAAGVDGEIFNIASGQPVSIRSMVETIVRIVGKGRPEFGKVPYRPGENMRLFADVSKAKARLGWEPRISLDEGLARTIAYFREQKDLK